MSVLSARSLPQGRRCDRCILDADPCQIGHGQIIVAGASLHDSFQKLAQSDRVLFAPQAGFDRVMELAGARCLAAVVDRDDAARASTSAASSCFAGSSEPTAVTWVPGSSQSDSTRGAREGVVVITMSAPRTACSTELQICTARPCPPRSRRKRPHAFRRPRRDMHAIDRPDPPECLELVARLASRADDRHGGRIRAGEEIGRDRPRCARPQLRQKAVVEEHAGKAAVDSAEHEHQSAVPHGAAVAGIEIGGDLHGPDTILVEMAGLDVREALRVGEIERDHIRKRRPPR